MNNALGSNRAEYSRKADLVISIRMTRSMMGAAVLKLKGLSLSELKAVWHETFQQAKAAGIIVRRNTMNTNEQVNGTEGTKQFVATIVVERVAEFERLVKIQRAQLSTREFSGHVAVGYGTNEARTAESFRTNVSFRAEDPSHDSRMKVGIRVGNQVATAELRYETDWNNSDQSKRKLRIVKVYGVNDLINTLSAIGINLDWTALFAEYKRLADAWQDDMAFLRKQARIASYDEGWAVKFVAHTTPQLATMGFGDMTLTATPTREAYINDERGTSDLRVQVTYKGKAENIWVERGEYRTYDVGFKTYRAKKVTTLLTHIKLRIDEQLAKTESERVAKLKRLSNLQTLQQRFPEYNIIQPYSDGTLRAQLSTREFSGHVAVGYGTNEARTAESFRVEGIAMTLNADEFKTIMDTLKAAQKRSDDRDAERLAANRRV